MRERFKNNLKTLKVLALILLMVLITSFSYASWDNLTQTKQKQYEIGNGVTLIVSEVVMGEETRLVPESAVLKQGDVTQLVYTYNINLDVAVLEDLNFKVEVKNVKLYSGNTEILPTEDFTQEELNNAINVFRFVIYNQPKINKTELGSDVIIVVTINDELLTNDIVKVIKNKTLKFDVEFSAYK